MKKSPQGWKRSHPRLVVEALLHLKRDEDDAPLPVPDVVYPKGWVARADLLATGFAKPGDWNRDS